MRRSCWQQFTKKMHMWRRISTRLEVPQDMHNRGSRLSGQGTTRFAPVQRTLRTIMHIKARMENTSFSISVAFQFASPTCHQRLSASLTMTYPMTVVQRSSFQRCFITPLILATNQHIFCLPPAKQRLNSDSATGLTPKCLDRQFCP